MFMSDIKKQASSFVQEKYKSAKLALADVTEAQILTEEAINNNSWGPDTKTMTKISEATYDVDNYWRIVGIIHLKLQHVNYKEWRQSYKALVLLEFLLTHGPRDLFEEFYCDINVIRQLGKMNYLDERGFNWGACMKHRSQKLLKLLGDEVLLMETRSKALKVSKEIQGFGNLLISPSSASSRSSRTSSFCSYNSDSPTSILPFQELQIGPSSTVFNKDLEGLHLWDNPIEEKGTLVNSPRDVHNEEEKPSFSWSTRFRTRIFGDVNQTTTEQTNETTTTDQEAVQNGKMTIFRSLSGVGKVTKKKIDRQLSLWF